MKSLQLNLLILLLLISRVALSLESISPAEAKNRIGERTTVCGKVSSIAQSLKSSGKPTFLNLGPAYPQHIFTVIIWGKYRTAFSNSPESLEGRNICVTGIVQLYRNIPQIEARSEHQIAIRN